MEPQNWTAETNWTISRGSLRDSVVFDSSDSPIDSQTANSVAKSPLVLKPPALDCGFCEIKINFKEKHEVRQVYVRSTARVYELYYAPVLQSGNEYLCTVRCGIAVKDEELHHASYTEEYLSAHLKGSYEELDKEKFKDEGNVGTSEDDWVEVKALDAPVSNGRNSSPAENTAGNTKSNAQDFCEATAEINDADPCISLTVRLLSLQSKGFVYVDEIYVFADPIEPADSENQVIQAGNSSQSSLMAMLLPTLMQLPKTGFSRIGDKHASDVRKREEQTEIGSSMVETTYDNVNNVKHDDKSCLGADQVVKSQDANEATAEPAQFQIPSPVLSRDEKVDSVPKSNFSCSQIERTLEELVSRVTRIEDICLRFEENMLKPIRCMETRLQHVEGQLEALSKNPPHSVLPSGTRISAPSFTCSDSNSSSLYNDGSDYSACVKVEVVTKDLPSDMLDNPPDDMSSSVNSTQCRPGLVITAPEFSCSNDEEEKCHPGLVVTAPEFSCGDDDEHDDVLEPSKDSPPEKPKQGLSVDDALAAALAGFLSTTKSQHENYTPTVTVKAPEFTIETDTDIDEIASPNSQNAKFVSPSLFSSESNGKECLKSSASHMNGALTEDVRHVLGNLNDGLLEEHSEVVEQDQFMVEETGCGSEGYSVDHFPVQAKSETKTNDFQITKETNSSEDTINEVNVPASEENVGPNEVPGNQTGNCSGGLQGSGVGGAEDIARACDILNAFKSSSATSVVDFDAPIFDVKFAFRGDSSSNASLEALFTDTADLNRQVSCSPVTDAVEHGSDLVPQDDGELVASRTSSNNLVDLDGCDVSDLPSTMEDRLQDSNEYSNSCSQETFASLV